MSQLRTHLNNEAISETRRRRGGDDDASRNHANDHHGQTTQPPALFPEESDGTMYEEGDGEEQEVVINVDGQLPAMMGGVELGEDDGGGRAFQGDDGIDGDSEGPFGDSSEMLE